MGGWERQLDCADGHVAGGSRQRPAAGGRCLDPERGRQPLRWGRRHAGPGCQPELRRQRARPLEPGGGVPGRQSLHGPNHRRGGGQPGEPDRARLRGAGDGVFLHRSGRWEQHAGVADPERHRRDRAGRHRRQPRSGCDHRREHLLRELGLHLRRRQQQLDPESRRFVRAGGIQLQCRRAGDVLRLQPVRPNGAAIRLQAMDGFERQPGERLGGDDNRLRLGRETDRHLPSHLPRSDGGHDAEHRVPGEDLAGDLRWQRRDTDRHQLFGFVLT